jgi:hypothetical protein
VSSRAAEAAGAEDAEEDEKCARDAACMLVVVTMERLLRGTGPREVSPPRTPTAAELLE